MKKSLSLILSIFILASSFVSCSGKGGENANTSAPVTTVAPADDSLKLYEEAVSELLAEGPKLDGTNGVSEALLTAVANAEYTEPKNFIFMIGDGMGFNIVKAAQAAYSDKLYNGTLAMNYMPVKSSQMTYSASDQITDSAAGGTALSTGFKTSNMTVGMNENDSEAYKTTLELAAEKGKSTGIVATKNITDATPASFTAHVAERSMEYEIASQQLQKFADGTLDLALGGGWENYEYGKYASDFNAAVDSGLTYTRSWDEAKSASLPLAGLFSEGSIDTADASMPTVAQMTDLALNLLSKDENGFFLMVEGSQIDSYGHNNEFERETKELYDFDCAIAVALRFVALNPDTVLIITADHETGGLEIPASPTAENIGESEYTTGNHTCKVVPVFAAGYGTEALAGINENADLAIFVASLMGESNYGQKSTVHGLLDTSDSDNMEALISANSALGDNDFVTEGDGAAHVLFDETHSSFYIPVDAFDTSPSDIINARAVHVTVKNCGDTPVAPPLINLKTPKTDASAFSQISYIEPGETVRLTYVLTFECWSNSRLKNINEMSFYYEEASSAELEFSDLRITDRPMGR